MSDSFSAELKRTDEAATVVLRGELDIEGKEALAGALARALEAPQVVVDLSQLAFMDSTGVGLLVRAAQSAAAAGVGFTVGPGPATVMRALEISGVLPFLGLGGYGASSNQTTLPSPGTGSAPHLDANA